MSVNSKEENALRINTKHDNELRYSRQVCEENLYNYETELLMQYKQNINFDDVKYIIAMFPYPSGQIHLGHIRNYTGADVLVRGYKLITGQMPYTCLGFDAFGLPAENAAKLHGIAPQIWTYKNIASMNAVFNRFNFLGFDRDKKLITCDPDYYKHQQKFMKYLYKRGILYRKKSWVNWDPVEQTVLANEQVVNGRGWRSNAPVERKTLTQWFINMEQYAEQLLNNLNTLTEWPEAIVNMQRAWIGKKVGVLIEFKLSNEKLAVFTATPELIFACTEIHVGAFSSVNAEYAIHPYTGAVIPIVRTQELSDHAVVMHCEYVDAFIVDGIMQSSGFLTDLTVQQARDYMFKNHKQHTTYALRDWCISRQRAWGTPLPFNHCANCGVVPNNDETTFLPTDLNYTCAGNPLDACDSWKNVTCHICGAPAVRDTDTMDTFVDSAWYFWRYPSADSDLMLDQRAINCMKDGIDIYIGGAEHANMHLIYCRAFSYMICDYMHIPQIEPIRRLVNQGMITAPTYVGEKSGAYYYPYEVKDGKAIRAINDAFLGENVIQGACAKISKSYKNSPNLQSDIDLYGTDALRMLVLIGSRFSDEFVYDVTSINGCSNLLNRIWATTCQLVSGQFKHNVQNKTYSRWLNSLKHNTYNGFMRTKFNTIVSDIHKVMNEINNGSEEQIQVALIFVLQWLWCISPAIATKCYKLMYDHGLVQQPNIMDTRFILPEHDEDSWCEYKIFLNNKKHLITVALEQVHDIVEIAKKQLQITSYQSIIEKHDVRVIKFII
jgi:leucyl-tRNA synthetase